MRTKTYLIVSTIVLAALLTGCAGAAFAQTETPASQSDDTKVTRTVSVTGSGKVYLTPDIAYITIGVHTEGDNAAEAVSQNNAQSQKVIDALKAQGIAAKDIQTTNFSIYPQQEFDTEGKPTGKIKYIVDNSVFVTVRDISKVGDVLDAAVQAGANTISGIQFDVADKTAALSEARTAAVKDAGVKAEELASAAGVTLGDVQSISEFTSGGPQPMYDMRAAAPAAQAAAVPIQTGQMLLTVDVNMVYEIR
jgi:uncharacterized protein